MVQKGYKQTTAHKIKKATAIRRGAFYNCLICNSIFWRQPSAIKKGDCKFCTRKCYHLWQTNRPKSEAWKRKRIENNLKKAKKYSLRKLHRFIRHSNEYKKWRKHVFIRDNYTCRKCEARSMKGNTIYIQAHHLKPFALFPEQRFILDNGITLCKKCHDMEPNGKQIYATNSQSHSR